MKKFLPLAVLLMAVLFLAAAGLAHMQQEDLAGFNFSFMDAFLYGIAALIVIALLSVHYARRMTAREKKAVFVLYIIVTAVVTVYIAAGTIYLNLTSTTGGPVHWHADFEVWVCGEKLQLIESEGFDNKVGAPDVHHHNDLRIHVEGVLQHLDEASVREFFHAIGGEFEEDELTVPLKDKTVRTWRNGELCPDGKPGKVRLFVNGKENFEYGKYIIAPYPDVPPGDFLNITFSAER